MTSVEIVFNTNTTHTQPIRGSVAINGADDLDTLISAARAAALAMGFTPATVSRITLMPLPEEA